MKQLHKANSKGNRGYKLNSTPLHYCKSRALAQGLWSLIRTAGLGPVLLRVHPKSALKRSGWFVSFRAQRPMDQAGKPLPWWTYSSIRFLEERLRPNHRVLEFGAGNSTLWLSGRVREVVCLEDDPAWAEELAKKIPDNATLHLVNSLDEVPLRLSHQSRSFDVVVVDGLGNRMACANMAIQHYLNDEGVLIWDNTDGPDWPVIAGLMASQSYQEISFHGMAPQLVSESRTTVFYRDINVLCI